MQIHHELYSSYYCYLSLAAISLSSLNLCFGAFTRKFGHIYEDPKKRTPGENKIYRSIRNFIPVINAICHWRLSPFHLSIPDLGHIHVNLAIIMEVQKKMNARGKIKYAVRSGILFQKLLSFIICLHILWISLHIGVPHNVVIYPPTFPPGVIFHKNSFYC